MIDEKKSKLFICKINNLSFEYEKLIDEVAKEFKTKILIPFCDYYQVDFIIKNHMISLLKEGVDVLDHEDLCDNELFEADWQLVRNILNLYVGIEGDYVLGNFIDEYRHKNENE